MKNSMLIHPEELTKKWIDRLADAGVGALGIHPRGGSVAVASLKELIEQMKTKEYRELIDYAHDRGLEVEYEMHTAGYLMPRELFKEHPEYFRMNDRGERVADCNFCVSNGEAMTIVAKRAAELAGQLYGSSRNFYFWMDDVRGVRCQCPRCKELSSSDQALTIYNRIVFEIRKYIPDAHVAHLAYQDTIVPPTKVLPAEGVFLEYAPYEKYAAPAENAAELIEREKRMVAPLMKMFENAPMKVLEYWYDNSLFSKWKKPPVKFNLDEETMKKDISEYRKMGFDAISTFACFLGDDYEEMHGIFDITPFGKAIK